VDASSISSIGESAKWLRQYLSSGTVTLTGVSFAGGISLLAASDPEYARHIRAVVLMGAYDDLARVSRFLVTSQAEFPDGHLVPYAAHEYGALVFIYDHLDQFFPSADLPAAHVALRTWLWEKPAEAQPWLARLSPNARATMELLFSHQVARLRPQLLNAIRTDRPELDAISPQGHIAGLEVPVYILHGSTDDIIPSTESLWLEKEVPRNELKGVLITPAFSHVDPAKHAEWREELRLVDFIARIVRDAS
jgi:pimeloyl-ACP methyl ester carboxylesterase